MKNFQVANGWKKWASVKNIVAEKIELKNFKLEDWWKKRALGEKFIAGN